MLSTHLNRRQLFWFKNCNKANFSMLCKGNHVQIYNKPILKCNNATTILQDRQQFRSLWHSRPLQNAFDNGSNTTGTEATEKGEEEETANDWPKQVEEKKESTADSGTVAKRLAQKFIRYGQQQQPTWLNVKYDVGKSGQKYLFFYKNGFKTNVYYSPKILVPEDVFAFVRAMDEVLDAVEANRDKIEVKTKSNHWSRQMESVLHTAMAKGTNKDFELDLCFGRFLTVQMRTVPNENKPEHKPRSGFLLPIEIFHWLRRAIGEVFVENGEPEIQQQLGKAPSLPGWLKHVVVTQYVSGR